MEKSQWYIGTQNGVVLCVDRMEDHQISGRFYHAYSREGIPFYNIEESLFKLEHFYDSLNYPHPSTNSRWQGRITWMDEDKSVYFRSIWEMIKLVASALDMVSEPEAPSWKDETEDI